MRLLTILLTRIDEPGVGQVTRWMVLLKSYGMLLSGWTQRKRKVGDDLCLFLHLLWEKWRMGILCFKMLKKCWSVWHRFALTCTNEGWRVGSCAVWRLCRRRRLYNITALFKGWIMTERLRDSSLYLSLSSLSLVYLVYLCLSLFIFTLRYVWLKVTRHKYLEINR